MYKIGYALMAVALLSACHSSKKATTSTSTQNGSSMAATASNGLTQDEQAAGWVSLFDGQTLKGWHSYGQSTPGAAWQVDNGTIHLDASSKKNYQTNGGGDLVTDGDYQNYDLKLDWRISPGGNSGIIFNIKEDTSKYKESWYTGLEMQVLDNDHHPDGKIPKHRAGNLYDLIPVTKETVKPVGEWNAVEIVNNRGKLDFYLNGEHVVDTRLDDDNWRNLVANSKFKDMPDFGKFQGGRIALQDHGNDVWFRNIRIKQL